MDNNIPKRNAKNVLLNKPDGKAVIAFCPPHPHCMHKKTSLKPLSLALWKRIDGYSSTSQIIDSLIRDGCYPAKVFSVPKILNTWAKNGLITWANQGQQEEQLSPREQRAKSIASKIFIAYQSAQKLRLEIQSSKEYHQTLNIKNPVLYFDREEETISHRFSSPHPALGGRTYGGRLWEKLSAHLKQRKELRMVEVGGGTGALARGFLNQLRKNRPDLWQKLSYVFIDLSTAFISSQRSKCYRYRAKTGFIQASGQDLPLSRSGVDLLMCNEVIADFDVIRLCHGDLKSGADSALPAKQQALDQIKRLGLSLEDAPPKFLFPWGAISFLEEVWQALIPGGVALVVEYGDESLYPREKVFKEHKEYSIHFNLLRKAAQSIGFKVKLDNLASFLSIDQNMQGLTRCGSCLLTSLLGNRAKKMVPKKPTRQMLSETLKAEFESLENLPFGSIESEFKNFWALFLRKPAVVAGSETEARLAIT